MDKLAFHHCLRLERMKRHWSQEDLAERAEVEPRTIGRWERGEVSPRPHNVRRLSEVLGMTAEELGLLDLPSLLSSNLASSSPLHPADLLAQAFDIASDAAGQSSLFVPPQLLHEVPRVAHLSGRKDELLLLTQWINSDRCKVVTILGIGGVGKSSLSARLAEQVRSSFTYVFWCTLQNAPPLEEMLSQCIQVLSGNKDTPFPQQVEEQISLLIYYLRQNRCLLVLDNVESILLSGRTSGFFREGYESYGSLIRKIGESRHKSCLLLTSREKPAEVGLLEGTGGLVRSLQLQGVGLEDGRELLRGKGLAGSDADWATLVHHYSGNPLALNLVAEPIHALFGGSIARFFLEGETIFGSIHDLLEQQLLRLSPQESALLSWLAIEREPVSLEQLRENLVQSVSKRALLEDLTSLFRRSMIEQYPGPLFTLQPVIMEYVTSLLVDQFADTFAPELSSPWPDYALVKALSHDYVRESQIRFLLAPVAQRLLERRNRQSLVQTFQQALATERRFRPDQSNYLAANVLHLLSSVQADLHGLDCSDLVIWQGHLQSALLPATNFSRSTFIASTFSNASGNVLSVAFSPDGLLLATGTATNEIWLYETVSGTPLLTCRGHTDGVWSVAFSPDGQRLVSSSDDQTIRLWNTRTGHCEGVLSGHTNRIKSVAFSPDGLLLASGSDDLFVRIWSVTSGECLQVLSGHLDRIWSVAFSPDGLLLATASTDQTVRLWSLPSGECLTSLPGHQGWVLSVAFSPDGTLLASGGDDRTIRLWHLASRRTVKILHGHEGRVRSLAFQSHGSFLASASEDRSIRLWDVHSALCLHVLRGHSHGVRSVAFDPAGTTLASGADDQTARLWDVSNARCLKTLQGYTNRVWALAFSPDGQTLLSGSEDQKLRLWQVSSGSCVRVIRNQEHAVRCLAFSPGRPIFASGGEDRLIRLWQSSSGACLMSLSGHTNWIRAIAFSPDGNMLASGSEDHAIFLWNTTTGDLLQRLLGHSSWIRAIAFSPDGKMLASCGDDQTVRLWEVPSGRLLSTLNHHTGQVRAVAFSPDGSLLASAGEDRVISLYDLQTHIPRMLSGHEGWMRSLDFSPDGKLLVSGSEEQTVCLWDVQSGTCLHVLRGHTNRVRSVAFSPLGDLFASSSDDGSIRLWHPQTGACLNILVSDRPYEGMQITEAQGLTETQRTTLISLGAFE